MIRRTFTVLLLFATGSTHADYIVASRHALVKTDPDRNADTLQPIERGVALPLLQPTQTNGYYAVRLSGGSEGWVYRTFVRRHAGVMPDGSGTPVSPSSAPTAAGPSYAYQCYPVSTDSQHPVTILPKQFFTVGYCEQRRDPLWVCYAIGPQQDLTAYPAKRPFKTDTDTVARISHNDYDNSGFSRGHMAPRFAISSRFGKAGNDSTFIMSNICPQFQTYNDGQWGNLEEWVAGKKTGQTFIRGWADEYDKVWVTIGPIFDEDRDPLDSGVEVPNAFYCIVVDVEADNKPRAMAFILEHEDDRHGDLTRALCTIREVEARTNLDFFSCLPEADEDRLETARAAALWPLPRNPN